MTLPRPTSSADATRKTPRNWIPIVVWPLLAVVTASLIVIGVALLIHMDLFASPTLSDDQLSSLWAFLGVALGVVATLIGTLLTDQNNRRVDRRLQESETRLTLETRAKVLELITDQGAYAQKARVGGAIATLMELQAGPVAIRILGDLWEANAIGTPSAVWMIERVLTDADAPDDEKVQAATLLTVYADKLVPAKDQGNQEWMEWPSMAEGGRWPMELPDDARSALLVAAENVLCAREPRYWRDGAVYPVDAMTAALADGYVAERAAASLDELVVSGAYTWLMGPPDPSVVDALSNYPEGSETGSWPLSARIKIRDWLAANDFQPVADQP